MGALCAAVYLLVIIVFIPFPFYKDIVAATSGGGNRDVVLELEQVETGRFLHRFPHNKVGTLPLVIWALHTDIWSIAGVVSFCNPFSTICRYPWYR